MDNVSEQHSFVEPVKETQLRGNLTNEHWSTYYNRRVVNILKRVPLAIQILTIGSGLLCCILIKFYRLLVIYSVSSDLHRQYGEYTTCDVTCNIGEWCHRLLMLL